MIHRSQLHIFTKLCDTSIESTPPATTKPLQRHSSPPLFVSYSFSTQGRKERGSLCNPTIYDRFLSSHGNQFTPATQGVKKEPVLPSLLTWLIIIKNNDRNNNDHSDYHSFRRMILASGGDSIVDSYPRRREKNRRSEYSDSGGDSHEFTQLVQTSVRLRTVL